MEDNKFNNSDKSTEYVKKTGMLGVFAVACVLFGSHAAAASLPVIRQRKTMWCTVG